MLKIAITGGAGSGKSVVARMFQELGGPGCGHRERKKTPDLISQQ